MSCSGSGGTDITRPNNNPEGGVYLDDSTVPDHHVTGTPEAAHEASGDVTSDSPTEAMADVSPDVPSEAAPDAGSDVTADGGGDAPVDVAIDHCLTTCGTPAVCTDVTSDPNNCNSCGNVCGMGGTCADAGCVCTGNAKDCGNKCVDETRDPKNCGSCGTVCPDGYCSISPSASSPTCKLPSLVASSGGTIEQIAIDSLYVYWTVGSTSGGVYARSLGGGPNITVLAPLSNPNAIAIGNSNLYWANETSGEIDWSSTYNATHNLTTVHPIVPGTDAGTNQPTSVAVDALNVYWTDIAAEAVYQAPRTGGTAVPIAWGQSQPIAIAVDANNVYWVNNGSGGPDGSIVRTPIANPEAGLPDGGAWTTLAAAQTSPQNLAVDGTYVYWTSTQTKGTVQAVSKTSSGSDTPIVIASGQAAPYGVVVDTNPSVPDYVYWTNSNDGTVNRASVPGAEAGATSPIVIASGISVSVPTAMAIDPNAGYVYWANSGGGTIERVQIH